MCVRVGWGVCGGWGWGSPVTSDLEMTFEGIFHILASASVCSNASLWRFQLWKHLNTTAVLRALMTQILKRSSAVGGREDMHVFQVNVRTSGCRSCSADPFHPDKPPVWSRFRPAPTLISRTRCGSWGGVSCPGCCWPQPGAVQRHQDGVRQPQGLVLLGGRTRLRFYSPRAKAESSAVKLQNSASETKPALMDVKSSSYEQTRARCCVTQQPVSSVSDLSWG